MTRLVFVALGLSACTNNGSGWVDFNAPDQQFVVEVTAEGTAPGPMISLDLESNVGGVPLGIATLDPGSGPVGTKHELHVDVFDDFQEQVGRASVEVDSEAVSDLDGDGEPDSRGVLEYELPRDSADSGVFELTLQSQGAVGEVREDLFTVHLWTPDLSTE